MRVRSSEWKPRKLDDLGSVGRGKSKHRPRDDPSLYGGDYPFFQTGDVKAAQFHMTEYSQTYNEKGLAQSKLWPPDTLCITIAANIAETAILGLPGCFPDSVVGFVADPQEADVRFVKYYIDFLKLQMQSISRGTTQDNLSVDKLLTFEFLVPPLTAQRSIADILSVYDDLIENCERRIRVLDEMARALYREWFVNFRYPGHEKVPLADSSLGRTPDGWDVPFPDCVDFREGPGLRNWQYRPSGTPFLNIRTLVGNDVDLSKVQFLDPAEVEDKYQHFLLEEYDHVVSSSGTIGRVVTIRAEHLPLMLNTSIIRMRPSGKRVGRWQLRRLLLSEYFQTQIRAFAIGAAQSNFGPSHLKQMRIVAPSESISGLFERHVEPVELELLALVRTTNNLRKTRDLLLPRLLSGQLSVDPDVKSAA